MTDMVGTFFVQSLQYLYLVAYVALIAPDSP